MHLAHLLSAKVTKEKCFITLLLGREERRRQELSRSLHVLPRLHRKWMIKKSLASSVLMRSVWLLYYEGFLEKSKCNFFVALPG